MIRRGAYFLSGSLLIGLALAPLGCGGAQQEVLSAPRRPASELLTLPDVVTAQLTLCISQGAPRLSETNYAIVFNVQVAETGEVQSAEVHDTILHDRSIESCMLGVFERTSLPTSLLTMRTVNRISERSAAPGSRAPIGDAVLVIGGAMVAWGRSCSSPPASLSL